MEKSWDRHPHWACRALGALAHTMIKEVTPTLADELLAVCVWSESGQPEQAHYGTLGTVFFLYGPDEASSAAAQGQVRAQAAQGLTC